MKKHGFSISPAVRIVDLEQLHWLPDGDRNSLHTTISFQTPEGVNVSAPWPLLSRSTTEANYKIPPLFPNRNGRLAVGKIHNEILTSEEAAVRVAILDGIPPAKEEQTLRWLQEGIDAVSSVYGRFPLDSVQVLVTPIGKARGEVPWGEVTRGGFPAVHLFVDQTDPYVELLDDWTLFHELSHLYIPLVHSNDRWLSEGLASYYQTVARARSGLIDETTAWTKLIGGMQNDIEQADDRRRFIDVMAAPGWSSIRLIYWTGAAIMMKGDIELRASSDNQQSLDWVLGEFQRCCLPATRLWTAEELLGKFDSIAGRPVFLPLAEDYLQRRGFPDIDVDLARMGVLATPSGKVSLDRNAPLAPVAAGIMGSRNQ